MIIGLSGYTATRDLLAAAVGFGAGVLNNLSAGGALVSYTVLLSGFRFSPTLAVVTNTAGLTAGPISGAVGHRRELRGQGGDGQPPLSIYEGIFLALIACLGGYAGSMLLMMLPAGAFAKELPRIAHLLARLRGPGAYGVYHAVS
jgi:hypothetical protein